MKQVIKENIKCSFQENGLIENTIYEKCSFEQIAFSDRISSPKESSIIRNVSFNDCRFNKNCGIGNGVLENVSFSNLKTSGIIFCVGTLFNKVSIKGKCGSLSITSETHERATQGGRLLSTAELEDFNSQLDKYYENIDWALDISQAEFKEFEIESSIPASLVKRNPEYQALVRFANIDMDAIENNKSIDNVFKSILRMANKDVILVASTLNKKYASRELESIRILREEGIAELD